MRVLVIEDDAGIRANVLELLEAEGFDGEGAVDGEAGVDAALARPPDLIVCDITMPRLDGFGVLERVRSTPNLGGVPFVFLSARSDAADVRAGMRRGADDYLTKPFSQAELLEVIRARLRRHEAATRQFQSRAMEVSPSHPRELLVVEDEPSSTPRYLVEQLLGEGGMGAVYRAFDRKLQRKVALKVLHRELAETEEGRDRLLREARAAAKLEHVNAVSIYDVGDTAEGPFLAMELVSGRTLRSYIGDDAVKLPTRVRWLIETARALAAAHAHGLVHRDVKPENIMVRDDGVVKVLDFGIARRAAGFSALEGPASTSAPAGTTIEGTPFYMAPEQLQGKAVDARADQYAWGVVAFELLAGRLPWATGGTPVAQITAMLARDAPTLASMGVSVPPAVSAVIARALSRDPAGRRASMGHVIAALEPFGELQEPSISMSATIPANMPSPVGTRPPAEKSRTTSPGARTLVSPSTREPPGSAKEPQAGAERQDAFATPGGASKPRPRALVPTVIGLAIVLLVIAAATTRLLAP